MTSVTQALSRTLTEIGGGVDTQANTVRASSVQPNIHDALLSRFRVLLGEAVSGGDEAELPEVAAIKLDGVVYRGSEGDDLHHMIYVNAIGALNKITNWHRAYNFVEKNSEKLRAKHDLQDGFVTTKGRFVSRVEAWLLLPQDVRDEIGIRDSRRWMDASDLEVLYAYERQPKPAKPLEDPNANPHYKGRTGD